MSYGLLGVQPTVASLSVPSQSVASLTVSFKTVTPSNNPSMNPDEQPIKSVDPEEKNCTACINQFSDMVS